MTAFAGSIGIIGIAAILALANGVNAYIKSVEEDTLSVYPLQIMSTGFDMTSMMVGSVAGADDGSGSSPDDGASGKEGTDAEARIGENQMITRMLSSIASNDLASLKSYFDSGESGIESYTNSIDYTYNVTPQIFDANTENGVRQINPRHHVLRARHGLFGLHQLPYVHVGFDRRFRRNDGQFEYRRRAIRRRCRSLA